MASFSLTTVADTLKTNFQRPCKNTYNSANETTSQIKKSYDLTGTSAVFMVPLSFAGGFGTGSLPTANPATYDQASITPKSCYQRVQIQREIIKASANDKGAFVKALKEVVKKGVESFMRNDSRIFFNSGDGALGTIAGAPTGSNPYVCTFAAGYNLANFEENDLINIETGNNDLFEITLVDPQSDGTLDVTVNRLSGSQVPADTDEFFMQGSEDNDPNGLKNVLDATSGSLYGVPVTRRWQATQLSASSSSLSTDLMNQVMLEVKEKTGHCPDHIVTSYTQWRKLANILEDFKRYPLSPRYGSEKLKAKISYNAIEFMSLDGPVPVVADRFCDADRMYFLKKDEIERLHRPDFGWFDDDGTIFLREADADSYEARYGGYYDNFIKPHAHGVLTSLAT